MQFVSNKRQASEIKSGSVTTKEKRKKRYQQRGCINFEFSPVKLLRVKLGVNKCSEILIFISLLLFTQIPHGIIQKTQND
jgi:hypothetical protein